LTTVSTSDVSSSDERRSRPLITSGRSDGVQVFRTAARHSRRVRMLRIALPVGIVVAGLVTALLVTWLDPLRALAKLPIDMGSMVVSGTQITMKLPRLGGYTDDRRPYEISAQSATQDLTKPDTVEMQEVRATVQMQDQVVVKISARTGVFETKKDVLMLRDNILILSSSGFEGRMTEVVVNTKTGDAVSDKPVEMKMQQADLKANRMVVTKSGEVIRFENGVTMILTMETADSPADATAKPR
jgi:lipopolysaccharide export system protein LptC